LLKFLKTQTHILVAQLVLERHLRVGEARTFGVRIKRLGEKGEWDSQSYARALGSKLMEIGPDPYCESFKSRMVGQDYS
jgi:adenylyl- and sulfurtransferase ThiI